jgi:C4-dicarboxylate-specific signal transduction histidine kinase
LGAVTICTAAFLGVQGYSQLSSLRSEAKSLADLTSLHVQPALEFQDAKVATETLKTLAKIRNVQAAWVKLPSGELFASFITEQHPEAKDSEGSDSWMVFREEREIEEAGSSLGTLIIQYDLEDFWRNLGVTILISFSTLALAAWLSRKFSSRTNRAISDRIDQILDVLHSIQHQQNYSLRMPSQADDIIAIEELERVSLSFDQMIAEIEKRDQNLEKTVEERTAELKSAQEQMLISGRMSALGEMAAGIAHEVNNPLTVISGRARQLTLMAQGREEITPEKILQCTDRIESTVKRIAAIVRSLRSFSRDGTQDPFENAKLSQIFQDVLEMCSSRFKNHGVDLIVPEIPEDFTFDCRATQIGQILLNLLNNAYDAISDKEGEKWVRVDLDLKSDPFSVRIVDCGTGIPPEVVKKIMEPFFTTKDVGKGTGLGLSISKGIAEGHQGRFYVDASAPNTTFVLELPRTQKEMAAPALPKAA